MKIQSYVLDVADFMGNQKKQWQDVFTGAHLNDVFTVARCLDRRDSELSVE